MVLGCETIPFAVPNQWFWNAKGHLPDFVRGFVRMIRRLFLLAGWLLPCSESRCPALDVHGVLCVALAAIQQAERKKWRSPFGYIRKKQ